MTTIFESVLWSQSHIGFPTLSVILMLLDGWVIEKKYVINKSKKQTITIFIKALAQTLASTKK